MDSSNHMMRVGLTQIAGVDACKGVDDAKDRWVAVTASVDGFDTAEAKTVKNIAELISGLAAQSVVAIDIPIGLPERTIAGGREPDWLARAFLGPRKASVFPVPSRHAVYAHEHDHKQIREMARKTSDPPRKPSNQVIGILRRIRKIDVTLRRNPALRERIFETHPEVSFQVMNDNSPLTQPKKYKGKIRDLGMQLRKELLIKAGFSLPFLEHPPREAGRDDFYDACACAWTAKRILLGTARVFPCNPSRDAEGLEQAIRA